MEEAPVANGEYVVERVDEGTPSRGPDNPNIVFGPDSKSACEHYAHDADSWNELNSRKWHRVVKRAVRASFDDEDD